jgi:hypothetical protein
MSEITHVSIGDRFETAVKAIPVLIDQAGKLLR